MSSELCVQREDGTFSARCWQMAFSAIGAHSALCIKLLLNWLQNVKYIENRNRIWWYRKRINRIDSCINYPFWFVQMRARCRRYSNDLNACKFWCKVNQNTLLVVNVHHDDSSLLVACKSGRRRTIGAVPDCCVICALESINCKCNAIQCNFNIKFGLEIEMLLQRFSLYAISDFQQTTPRYDRRSMHFLDCSTVFSASHSSPALALALA